MSEDVFLCGHYGDLLGLALPWRVKRVDLDMAQSRVDVWVAYAKGEEHPFCPERGQEGDLYDRAAERTWRHLDTMQSETRIHCRVPCCRCREHGVKTVAAHLGSYARTHG